jgi:acetyl esterase/lipase
MQCKSLALMSKAWSVLYRRLARTVLLVSFFLCFTYTASAQQKAESEEAYGPLPAQKLVLCRPRTAGARSPGVLLLHGGGWVGGTAADLKGRCELFAQHGFVAATVEYRLASDAAHWPAQREDAQLALQWLRAHSDAIGLDGDHICAYGESAGGHIALGLGAPEDKIACIVDAFGPTDLTVLSGPAFQRSFNALLGEDDATRLLKAREASPLFNLGPSFPPVLIIQGEDDTLIPPEQSTALFDALRRLKTPVMAIMYAGGHSWLGLDKQASAAIMNHIIIFMQAVPQR